MIQTVGDIILFLFITFIIAIILVPILIAVFFYFILKGNTGKFNLTETIKSIFTKIQGFFKTKVDPKKYDKNGNKIEDAEFRELN